MIARDEPVAVAAAIQIFVQALMVALTVMGVVDLGGEQQAALMALVTAGIALGTSVIARGQVTPTSQVVASVSRSGEQVAGPASSLPDGVPIEVQATGDAPSGPKHLAE